MPRRLASAVFAGWGARRVAAFFLCIGSMPVWLVSQGMGWQGLSLMDPPSGGVSPLLAASLAAMFVALAMLFVCLVKTAHARIGRSVLCAGAAAYAAGYACLAASVWMPAPPPYFAVVAAVPLGMGAAVLCLAWALRVRWPDCSVALAGALLAVLAGCAVGAALFLVGDARAVIAVLAALGCAGAAGSVWALAPRAEAASGDAPAAAAGGRPVGAPSSGLGVDPYEEPFNWWDVFGRLDVSMVSGGDEFKTPASRVMFFVVTPLLVLLLFLANVADLGAGLAASSPVLLAGTDLGVLLGVPLLFVGSARGLVNVSFRIYLPLLAFAVLAVALFVMPEGLRAVSVQVGVGAYCSLYALLMAVLLLGMAGRSRALALPCASILILVFNLTVLLAVSPAEMVLDGAVRNALMLVLLVGSVALLMTMPSTKMWSMMVDMLPAAPAAPRTVPLEERCRGLARERGLTEREGQVFPYLARGHGAAYIAEELGVSESTVRSHRTNIYRKFGVASREELIVLVEAPPEPAPGQGAAAGSSEAASPRGGSAAPTTPT